MLLDFLRLSGAMILTDYLLLESIQHRIGANKIRVRFTTEFFSNTDLSDSTLSLQKNATQSHKLQNNQGKSMIAEDSFVPLL